MVFIPEVDCDFDFFCLKCVIGYFCKYFNTPKDFLPRLFDPSETMRMLRKFPKDAILCSGSIFYRVHVFFEEEALFCLVNVSF